MVDDNKYFEDIRIPTGSSVSLLMGSPDKFIDYPYSSIGVPRWLDLRDHYDISPPTSQRRCGMCWAITLASVIDDTAAVSGGFSERPGVSPTLLLAMFPQHGCLGGNSLFVANSILGLGYVLCGCQGEEYVRNNSLGWCWDNPDCGDLTRTASSKSRNSFLPTEMHCQGGARLQVIAALHAGADNEVRKNTALAKRIISTVGPLLVNVFIFDNFSYGDGQFAKMGCGIYVDSIDYEYFHKKSLGKTVSPSSHKPTSSHNLIGTHSLSIIGFGIEMNANLPDGRTIANLPYWVVRNSWGTNWADGGYAKLAAYPYSERGCVIGVGVSGIFAKSKAFMGGFLAIRVLPFADRVVEREKRYNYTISTQPSKLTGSKVYGYDDLMVTRTTRTAYIPPETSSPAAPPSSSPTAPPSSSPAAKQPLTWAIVIGISFLALFALFVFIRAKRSRAR